MDVKENPVAMEAPAPSPVTHRSALSANAHLVFQVLRVNTMLKSVVLFTATMEERVYLVTKAQNVCALNRLLDQNASSLLTTPALRIHATTAALVRTLRRHRFTVVSALPTSMANDATSWIVVCRKRNVKFPNVKS